MLRHIGRALTSRFSAALTPPLAALPFVATGNPVRCPIAAIGTAWCPRFMTDLAQAAPPAAHPERPRWWNLGEATTAEQAYKAFMTELRAKKNVRERALQEVAVRIKSPEDAALALKAALSLRRHRAARQLHEPFRGHTARVLLEAMVRAKAPAVAAAAVAQRVGLGLPVSLNLHTKVVKALGAAADWPTLAALARGMHESGVATNSVINYTIARTAAETGHLKEGRRLLAALDPDFSRSPPCTKIWLAGEPPAGADAGADAEAGADAAPTADPVTDTAADEALGTAAQP